MTTWALEDVFEARTPSHCLVISSNKMLILAGTSHPREVSCLPGKWNVFVPHVPFGQLPYEVAYNSLGVCLVNDAVDANWLRDGAFCIKSEVIVKKSLDLFCNNSILGFADAACSKAHMMSFDRDKKMAAHYETFVW